MHRMQLLLPDDVYERVRLIAFQRRRSLADVIREAIRQYLAAEEGRKQCSSDQTP